MLLTVFSIALWSQNTNNAETFYREKLLGKKWTMSKEVGGQSISYSFIFDNDSVTNTISVDGNTMTLRYAYYFAEYFQGNFDNAAVGNTTCGKWFFFSRNDKDNIQLHRDEVQMRIFALNEHGDICG